MMPHLRQVRGAPGLLLVFLIGTVAGCGLIPTSGYEDTVTVPRPAKVAAGEPESAAREGEAASSSAEVRGAGPLEVGVEDAILLALENNRGFSVQRLAPAKQATFEEEAAAAFDPTLAASGSTGRAEDWQGTGSAVNTEAGSVDISSSLPTGTRLGLDIDYARTDPSPTGDTDSARVGLSVTQPLMRGASPPANLAAIHQAALDVRSSEYELRGYAESLVAQVETAYWDCALAGRRIEIHEESLRLAEKQLSDTRERINVGKLAGTELAAARAEVASRREALISARGTAATARIRLLRLFILSADSPGGGFLTREVVLRDPPAVPPEELAAVTEHVRTALRSRADLNQARLSIRRGELEVVKTRNGLLPKLDLFINLGRTGYSDSFAGAVDDLDGNGYDISGGLTFEWVIGNRGARARHRRAELSRKEAAFAFDNLVLLAQVDVHTAYVAATTAGEQISATAATRALKAEVLRAETEKFRVGKATTFQVALAQRDLVASRLTEVEAVAGYLKALVELYRVDGSLLRRRGIAAPGESSPEREGMTP